MSVQIWLNREKEERGPGVVTRRMREMGLSSWKCTNGMSKICFIYISRKFLKRKSEVIKWECGHVRLVFSTTVPGL